MPPKKKPIHTPGVGEICKRVYQAIEALENGYYTTIDGEESRHSQESLRILGVHNMDEVMEKIYDFLKQVKEIGPAKCFPSKTVKLCSHHKKYENDYMYGYKLKPEGYDDEIYFKFCIKEMPSADGTIITYCHLNCHISYIPKN